MIETTPDGILLDVRVIPRARKSVIAGTRGGAVLVRLSAPPVDGAANEALIALLAAVLDVNKGAISIESGGQSRQKRLRVMGIDIDAARSKLNV